jgi:hypothetical protein
MRHAHPTTNTHVRDAHPSANASHTSVRAELHPAVRARVRTKLLPGLPPQRRRDLVPGRVARDAELESILLNLFGRNLRIKPNLVIFKLVIMALC